MSDPKYLKLSERSNGGVQYDLRTGFGVSGRAVVKFPENENAADWARMNLRRGVLDEATKAEFDSQDGGGVEPEAPAPSAEVENPYAEWNVEQLDEELAVRELPKTGNKAEKAKRLFDDDEEDGS